MRLANPVDESKHYKSPVHLGKSRHSKWFGITLLRYEDAFRDDLLRLYAPHFAESSSPHQIEPTVRRYRAGIFAIAKTAHDRTYDVIGFTSFLPLSEYGRQLIEFGLFDGADIDPDALAGDFSTASALYWWATVAEGQAFRALPLVELALSQAPLAGKDIFATAGTPRGLNAMTRLGFSPLQGEAKVGSIVIRRSDETAMEMSHAH